MLMIPPRAVLVGLLSLAACGAAAPGEVVVHEAPEGAPRHAGYRVSLRVADEPWREVFVYDAVVGEAGRDHMGFVSFDADFVEPVELRVVPTRKVQRVRVRPGHREIEHRFDGQAVHLTIDRARQLSVEFDDELMNNLAVFANPLEDDPITEARPGVRYFGPGVHKVGGDGRGALHPEAGETIYIAGGAIVYGRIDTGGKDDITIRGRGILAGTRFPHDRQQHRPQMVYVGNARNVRLKGITLLDAPGWNVHLHQVSDVVVRNVKIIAWMPETDGINPRGAQEVLIADCFIRTGDDCISINR